MKTCIRILLLIFSIVSCTNQNEFVFPLIQTGEVTDIDSTGAVFHARISDLSKDNILEYGFVWGLASNPGVNSARIVVSESPKNGTFSTKISTDLVPNTIYFVQAFARNGSYDTYGRVVSFKSKGSLTPVILGFEPKEGSAGTQVTITGKNFSESLSGNTVKFGRATAIVNEASNEHLLVTLPSDLNISGIVNITVKSSNNIARSLSTFLLQGCNIVDFEPHSLMIGDTIYIHTKDSGTDILNNTLNIGASIAEIIQISDNTIMAYVPYIPNMGLTEISLTFDGKTCYSKDSVLITTPWSKIDGNNPFYRYGEAGFSIGSNGYLGFGIDPNGGVGNIGPFKDLWEFNSVTNTWKRCADLPGLERESPVTFSIKEKGYVCLGKDHYSTSYNDMYEYDPSNNSWIRKADFPGESRFAPFGLVIGAKAYCGLGVSLYSTYKDFWEYNPENNNWTRLTDFPGGGIYNLIGFSHKEKGYVCLGETKEIWEYSTLTDSWKRLADFPGTERRGAVCFSIGNFGYVGMGDKTNPYVILNDFWRFDIENNKWTRIADVPYKGRTGSISFTIENKGFICSGMNENVNGTHAENFIVFNPNQ